MRIRRFERPKSRTYAVLLVLSLVFGAMAPAVAASEESAGRGIVLERALLLGPLPADPAPAPEADLPRGDQVRVPEITPGRHLPDTDVNLYLGGDGTLRWREAEAGDEGAFDPDIDGAFWLVARLHVAEHAEVEFSVSRGTALYMDREELDVTAPGEEPGELSGSWVVAAGWVTVWVRAETGAEVSARARPEAEPVWTLAERLPLFRFDASDEVASAGALAVSDGAELVARRLYRRDGDHKAVDVFGKDGDLLAAQLGGPDARPVAFLPDSETLLLRRHGDEATDLLLWRGPTGPVETTVHQEPDLGLMRIGPRGELLLLASTRGFVTGDPADGPGRRWVHLRERVADYDPRPHLHLVDLKTGSRRQLTRAGDFVLDDAVFLPDRSAVIYGRTLPMAERPWFRSEIRRLDLATGEDTLLAEFTGGWEVRPQAFAVDHDGEQMAFIGPPDQVGGGRVEHNVYHKQVWLLDLQTGAYERITRGLTYAFEGGGGLPVFTDDGSLLVQANDRSRVGLVRLHGGGGDPWRVDNLPRRGETVHTMAVSPSGDAVAYAASSPAEPAALYAGKIGQRGDLIEAFNADLAGRWLWSDPVAADCTGPDGDPVEAWLYRPFVIDDDAEGGKFAPPEDKTPLVVYYYGGSGPTQRFFNTTHQFFAANGYAVLVVNSRGAAGYGDDFADHHAGDWGPRSGADIIAAVDHVLEREDWLDADAVGIYGGSYGGFMTDWLVTRTDMFAAAVSMYGISDLATYWGQGTWGWTYGDMALAGATPWGDPEYFLRHSPLFAADRINTPLLLLHGEADANVTPGESVQLFTALAVQGKPVEMVLFADEDHGISGTWDNRRGHRAMILEWYDRFLRDRPLAWEGRWK